MRRGLVAFFALSLVGLGLTGCGLFRFEQREPWRSQAEEACLAQRLVQPSAYVALSAKIDGPGVCGMDYPFKISAFNNGSVGLTSKVTLACPIIPRIDTWIDEIVKPAAVLYFGVPVVDLKAGSYSCRPRNNQRGAKVSEHAFGNALDVMAFILADGREIAVAKGWRGDPAEQDFLREVFVGACRYFSTVLAPGSDAFHYDHLHIDLARHDPRGTRRICKPVLKFAARIDPERSRLAAAEAAQTADLAPVDMEQDLPETAYAADPGPAPASSAPVRTPLPPGPLHASSVPPGAGQGPFAGPPPAPGAYGSQVPPPRPVATGPVPPAYRPVAPGAPLVLNGAAIY